MVEKAIECSMPGCNRIAVYIIDGKTQLCKQCWKGKPPMNEKKESTLKVKNINPNKVEKIIETYLDLAQTIESAGGSVRVISDYRNKPLSTFLEEICSTNNIRFKYNRKG